MSKTTRRKIDPATKAAGIGISMDGRGRWLDNVFIERLWRSLKYEEVYLKAYTDGREARVGIAAWFAFYNGLRPHQALAGRTPMAVWRVGSSLGETAVDMTLPPAAASLDDAFASPTCPPRPPQQQPLEAAQRNPRTDGAPTLATPSSGPHDGVHLMVLHELVRNPSAEGPAAHAELAKRMGCTGIASAEVPLESAGTRGNAG